MTNARDLDDYVRQATTLNPDQAALLTDADTRRELLSRIVATAQPRRRGVRPRIAVVAAGLAVAAMALLVTRLGPSDEAPAIATQPSHPTSAQPTGDLFGEAGGFSCVEVYSEWTLPHRRFAFDGTVETIGQLPPGEDSFTLTPVTFRVNRWFRGGQSDRVTIGMFPPDHMTHYDNPPYRVGSRLLVSGERIAAGPRPDDLVSWACGFTRWYDPVEARRWERALR